MAKLVSFIVFSLAFVSSTIAFPAYASLAGLSQEELERVLPTLQVREPASPPPPLTFNGTKLVNDARHPWKPLMDGDIRGPCPGLNALASHGVRTLSYASTRLVIVSDPQYLPRNGIASPAQIIAAVQEGMVIDFIVSTMIDNARSRFQHGILDRTICNLCRSFS